MEVSLIIGAVAVAYVLVSVAVYSICEQRK